MSRRALAVFHGHGAHVFSPLLKDGFKHVFCAVDDGNFWTRIDMMAGVPEIETIAGSTFDLAAFYRDEGLTVVETVQCDRPPATALWPASCVSLVKALLAIDAPHVLTPWQLFKYLSRKHGGDRP
jgi:hypothetical protein